MAEPTVTMTRAELLELLTTAAVIGFGVQRKTGFVRGDFTRELLTYPSIRDALPAA